MTNRAKRIEAFNKAAAQTPDRSLAEIESAILENSKDQKKGTFDGLRSSEIAARSRHLMFGDNDEAFPSQEEWSRIVD